MNVLILATENCNHRPLVEKQLKKMNISYEVQYVDKQPELIRRFSIFSSPNIIVNGEIAFRANEERSLPTKADLEAMFS
ncbi:MAG: thioredoxin family protein [Gracilimonas sp.]|uniref:thioredoxin family protein n=1 Tax=Gracilimonas sp. TaxID=1974203 RepID=UPI003752CB21|nr:thioredoxin family protein [Gracilimonas sp.]